MDVKFYATLRDIVGGRSVHFDLPVNVTARDLLAAMFEKIPPLQKELVNDRGELHNYVHLFINGRDVRYMDTGMDTPIGANDVVSVFPAVGGG